jgi:hypothetical protein
LCRQQKLLGKDAIAELIGKQPKVAKWLEAVQEATSPHFLSVSDILLKAADMYQKKRERDQAKKDGSNEKSKL